MKALIIADNETVVKKIQNALENNGCDTIVYRWLLKALDNVIEIAPDVTVISAFDYPRHWKTLVQFENAILEKKPVIILFRPEDISKEEIEKEIALGVKGYISELDEAGLNKLKSLLENFQDSSDDKRQNEETASEIETVSDVEDEEVYDEVPTVDSLLGSEFVEQNSGMIDSAKELLDSLALPTVDNLFTEDSDGYLPTVDEINRLECDEPYGVTLKFEKSVTEDCELPDVDKIFSVLPELPENAIPTVDDIFSRLNVSLIDIPETYVSKNEYEMKIPETEAPVMEQTEEVLAADDETVQSEETSAFENDVLDSVEIPSIKLFENIHSEKTELPSVNDIESTCDASESAAVVNEKPRQVSVLNEVASIQLEYALIPSVDQILEEGQNLKITRKHSLLARILEMYGE